jgi:hypothetical protein
MLKHCFVIAGLSLLPLCGFQPLAAQNAKSSAGKVKQYTIEQFMKTVRIGGADFSPDDKDILFFNNQSGIFNVYSVPVAGGAAKQFTHSTKESTFSVGYLPDGRFLYRYDRGGNEMSTFTSWKMARNAISPRAKN